MIVYILVYILVGIIAGFIWEETEEERKSKSLGLMIVGALISLVMTGPFVIAAIIEMFIGFKIALFIKKPFTSNDKTTSNKIKSKRILSSSNKPIDKNHSKDYNKKIEQLTTKLNKALKESEINNTYTSSEYNVKNLINQTKFKNETNEIIINKINVLTRRLNKTNFSLKKKIEFLNSIDDPIKELGPKLIEINKYIV